MFPYIRSPVKVIRMQQQIQRQGVLYALGAYTLWGLAPIYFKTLSAVPAAEILTHRMIWSCALLMVLVPDMLVGLFIDLSLPGGGEVAQLAATFLLVAALFQLADGAQAALSGMLRGLQDTFVPMLLAGFGYWVVGMPVAWLCGFPLGLEGVGVWLGLAAGLAFVAVVLTLRFAWREKLHLIKPGELAESLAT